MKKALGTAILIAACALSLGAANNDNAATASPDPSVVNSERQAIADLTQQLNEAALHNDASTYKHLLADNYTAVNSQGQVQTKQMVVEATRKHAIKFTSVQTKSLQVELSGDKAISTDVAVVKGTYQHRAFAGTYGSKRVWEKHDGQWQLVSESVFDAK